MGLSAKRLISVTLCYKCYTYGVLLHFAAEANSFFRKYFLKRFLKNDQRAWELHFLCCLMGPYAYPSVTEMCLKNRCWPFLMFFARINQSTPVSGENDRWQWKCIAPPLKSNRTKFLREWKKYRRVTSIRVVVASQSWVAWTHHTHTPTLMAPPSTRSALTL